MASGDTKTEQMLNVLGNGGSGDEFRGCCNTKTQSYILDAIDRINALDPSGGTNAKTEFVSEDQLEISGKTEQGVDATPWQFSYIVDPETGDVVPTLSDGNITWDLGTGGGGPTVVQTTGTSTDDVMSQNATTSMIYADPANQAKIRIGNTGSIGTNSLTIGNNSFAFHQYSVAVGDGAQAKAVGATSLGYGAESSGNYSVTLGYGSKTMGGYSFALPYSNATETGVVQFGLIPAQATNGYNSSQYRLLSGLYDGQDLHDAATVAQGNTLSTSAPTTSTVGVLGQLYTDTTNMHTYQLTSIDTTDPANPVYSWTQRW